MTLPQSIPMTSTPTDQLPPKSPNPCWRFMQGKPCLAELCHYQHGPPLHNAPRAGRTPKNFGPPACLFYVTGHCAYGERCGFAHVHMAETAGASTSSTLVPDIPMDFSSLTLDAGADVGTIPDSDIAREQEDEHDEDVVKPNPFDDWDEFIRESSPLMPTTEEHLPSPLYITNSEVESPASSQSAPTTPLDPSSNPEVVVVDPPPDEETAQVWEWQESTDDERVQYIDRTKLVIQVYDERKVTILSGGVMLGPRADYECTSPTSAPSLSISFASLPSIKPNDDNDDDDDAFFLSPVQWNSPSSPSFDWAQSTHCPQAQTRPNRSQMHRSHSAPARTRPPNKYTPAEKEALRLRKKLEKQATRAAKARNAALASMKENKAKKIKAMEEEFGEFLAEGENLEEGEIMI